MKNVTIKIEEDDCIYEYHIGETLTDQDIEDFGGLVYGINNQDDEHWSLIRRAFIMGAKWARDSINSRQRKETYISEAGDY